jgi:hypothetical protein
MKAICIKSKTFDYGGDKFIAEKGKVYEYTKDNFGYNIQDENRRTLYYPIITIIRTSMGLEHTQLNFHEFFTDLSEHREQKIDELFN